MKIGEKVAYSTTVRRGNTATMTRREGTVLKFRTVRQALVKRDKTNKTEWIDIPMDEEIEDGQ